ncbi:MAG: peptide-methionine (S)-S-oxide reductase MsrA [Spirochaetaceae bacterium]
MRLLILLMFMNTIIFASSNNELQIDLEEKNIVFSEEDVDTAIFAGGCFWGVEAVYEALEGVYIVESGYSGGAADTASYNMVGTGKTGHAEVVKIVYNPEIISFKQLLDVFFTVAHDPTQLNYQGPDKGTEYRSAIFYVNENQKMESEKYIKELKNNKVFKQEIVTEITPLEGFYIAETYHQDFMRLNPTHPYIVYWDIPKINHLKNEFPELLSSN